MNGYNQNNPISPDKTDISSNACNCGLSRESVSDGPLSFTGRLILLETVDSTNSYALREISQLDHHTIVIADIQTGGKGRLQRTWISDSTDNLYMSIVIKPGLPFTEIPLVNFTQYFSLALCKVLTRHGAAPVIKWPNDVIVNGAKIAGILSEAVFEGSRFHGLVLGAGINLNSDPSASHEIDQPVISLSSVTGQRTDKINFAGKLFEEYLRDYRLFVTGGFRAIKKDFLSFFPHIGKEVTIKNSTVNGPVRVVDVSDTGELLIDDKQGPVKTIALGDMIWNS